MQNAIWAIVGIVVGGIITWFVSRKYYIHASRDLEAETKKIRNLLRITLTALEDANMVKLVRDENGQITGRYDYGSGNVILPAVSVSASGFKVSELDEVEKNRDPKPGIVG